LWRQRKVSGIHHRQAQALKPLPHSYLRPVPGVLAAHAPTETIFSRSVRTTHEEPRYTSVPCSDIITISHQASATEVSVTTANFPELLSEKFLRVCGRAWQRGFSRGRYRIELAVHRNGREQQRVRDIPSPPTAAKVFHDKIYSTVGTYLRYLP